MEINEKIIANEKLVYYTINRFFPELIWDDDVIQIGRIALWKAIMKNIEPKAFSSYAVTSIKNAILNELKRRTSLKRGDRNFQTVYLDDGDNEQLIGYDEIPYKIIEINDYKENTTEIKKEILNMITQGYNLTEIANKLDMSYSKIYRIWKEIKSDINI